nr:MAG TPA: replisome organizer [Caudoviricetes sp.]
MNNKLNGYIKLHRKLVDWEWYTDVNVKVVFLHLLLTANFKKNVYQGIEVLPGQTIVGTNALAVNTGLSRQQVRTALNKLVLTNEITIKSTNKFSLITIENWSSYQFENETSTNKSTNKSTNNQPHLKNDKKYKEDISNKCVYMNNSIKGEGQRENTHPYGEFSNVFLTDDEYAKLTSKYMRVDQLIDKVSIWLTEHTRKNHYAACLTFARNDSWEKRKAEPKREKSEDKEKPLTEEDKKRHHEMAIEVLKNLKSI